MNCKCGRRPPATTLPPEWDARVAVGGLAYRFTAPTVPATTETRLVRTDPKRVMVGFTLGPCGAATRRVFVGGMAQSLGWMIQASVLSLWFTLQDYGPIVCAEWYGYTSLTEPFGVLEVYQS